MANAKANLANEFDEKANAKQVSITYSIARVFAR